MKFYNTSLNCKEKKFFFRWRICIYRNFELLYVVFKNFNSFSQNGAIFKITVFASFKRITALYSLLYNILSCFVISNECSSNTEWFLKNDWTISLIFLKRHMLTYRITYFYNFSTFNIKEIFKQFLSFFDSINVCLYNFEIYCKVDI